MLSFAIPGTVIGVSYILAFNVPPIEITGTALILVVCNVFRNMPVGVRAGMASMTQIDRSLDEASATLGARGFTDAAHDPAAAAEARVVAALVYSFVRAMTTVSAVIFLVSARIRMGDDLHHQSRRQRRLRRRDRVLLGADRADAGRDLDHPDARRRAAARPAHGRRRAGAGTRRRAARRNARPDVTAIA